MPSSITLALHALLPAFTLAVLFGCASVPRPVQDLETATSALQLARTNGAPQFAVQQWQLAQNKFASANQLLEQGLHAAAARALQQATADAKLAEAMAQLQRRVAEQHALQKEIEQLLPRIKEVELSTRAPVEE